MTHPLGAWAWAQLAATTAAFATSAAFAVVYHLRAPWWRSAVGRNLMGLAVAIAVICLTVVAPAVWPTAWPHWLLLAVRTVLLLVVAAVMAQRTRMVWAVQKQPPADRPRGGGA